MFCLLAMTFGYVNGNLSCPSPTLADKSPNPDYSFCIRQDSLLLGVLLASLSPQVHQIVATTKTSHKAWQKLTIAFARPSRSWLLQLHKHVKSLKKNNLSRNISLMSKL